MAEAHPVGFRWVMKAKERGAKVFHVDPRFARRGAWRTTPLPIRAGSDIAFLGGLIREVLERDAWFKDYVMAYTNIAHLVSEKFEDTEDLDGVFSGFDEETGLYDGSAWVYEGGEVAASAGVRGPPARAFAART